jgi:DNA-binding NarL/FixJ family response regulator
MSVHEKHGAGLIRVVVLESSQIHSQLLADGMSREGQLQAIAVSSSEDFLQSVNQHAIDIDVVVISSTLDEEPGRGFEVLRAFRGLRPSVPAVMMLESSKREMVVEAFRAGARGVLGKQSSLTDLCKCVQCVHSGQVWANAAEVGFALDGLANSPAISAVDHQGMDLLSEREADVVHWLAQGLTNREIGERLGLSRHTVKNYLFRIFDKIGVSSRMELLYLTLRQPGTSKISTAPKDPLSEFEICQQAAENGSPTAQIRMAEFHRSGEGTPKDNVAAYMWYLLSERTTADLRERSNSAKSKLVHTMKPEDILEAQQRAAEWLTGTDAQDSAIRPASVRLRKELTKFSTA